jgi:hypothetical protein
MDARPVTGPPHKLLGTPIMTRTLAALLITQIVLAWALPEALAQDAMTLSRVQKLNLESLPGPVPTYYSPGMRPRAEMLQRRVREAVTFFETRYQTPVTVSLAILNESHLTSVAPGSPAGMFASVAPLIVVVPAFPESGIVAQIFRKAHAAATSPEARRAWERLAVSHEAAVSQVLDAMVLHEVGHTYVNGALGFRNVARWLNEFMATYIAYTFLRSREPAAIETWNAVSLDIVDAIQPSTRRLDEFNRLYVGVGIETYGWFQSHFNLGVTAMLPQKQDANWFEELRAAGLDKDSRSLTTSELVDRLDRIAPGLKRWAETLEAAP